MGRKWFKRLAGLLFAGCMLAAVPCTAAEEWHPTLTACIGSDGLPYYKDTDYWTLTYLENGETEVHYNEGGTVRRKYELLRDTGESCTVYCIGAGLSYRNGGSPYTEEADPAEYWERLPPSAKRGISYALLFGYTDGAAIPIEGVNENDYWLATQVLIWEYQQGIRIGTEARRDNGPVGADVFYHMLEGRPAERCYDWMLDRIRRYETFPSFVMVPFRTQQPILLVQEEKNGPFRAIVEDSNDCDADTLFLYDAGDGDQPISWMTVTATRENGYEIVSERELLKSVTVTARKTAPEQAGAVLLFSDGSADTQTMAGRGACKGLSDVTGTFSVRTQRYVGHGCLRLIKSSETGEKQGFCFQIQGVSETNADVCLIAQTDSEGVLFCENLPEGEYAVTELFPENTDWQSTEVRTVTISDGETAEFYCKNVLQTGSLLLQKKYEGRESAFPDASFEIIGVSHGTEVYRHTVVLPENGELLLENLPIGAYQVRELAGAQCRYYVLCDAVTVDVKADTTALAFLENRLIQSRISFTKRLENGIPEDLAAVRFGLYTRDPLMLADGTILAENACLTEASADASGTVCFSLPLPLDGSYYVREVRTAAGYELDPNRYPVLFDPETTNGVQTGTLGEENILYNRKKPENPQTGESESDRAVWGCATLIILLLLRRIRKRAIAFCIK